MRECRGFRLLWLSSLLAYFSISTTTIVLLSAVSPGDGGHLQQGLVLATNFLPAFALIPVADRLIGRVGAGRVVMAAKLASALLVVGLAVFGERGGTPAKLAINTCLGASTTLFIVASGSFTPRLVERRQLMTANVLNSIAPGSMLAIAGAMMVLRGRVEAAHEVYVAVVAAYLVSAAMVARIPGVLRRAGEPPRARARARVSSLGYLVRHAPLARAFVLRLVLYVGSGAQVLLSILGDDHYDAGQAGIGLLFGARGLGMMVGPFLVYALVRRHHAPLGLAISVGLGIYGAGFALVGMGVDSMWACAALFAVAFMGASLGRAVTMTLIQARSAAAQLPGVLAVEQGATAVVQSLTAVAIGAYVDRGGVDRALQAAVVVGVVLIGVGIASAWEVRRLPPPEPEPDQAS